MNVTTREAHPTPEAHPDCRGVIKLVSILGDKWTVQVVVALNDQPRRFNDIKRNVSGISQQMLTRALKGLERHGLVERTVLASTPPQVEYTLTSLGHSLSEPLRALVLWGYAHREQIYAHCVEYDNRR